ncbi:MAG: hypothetical protein WD097_08030 [Balneolales bacterium]
MTAQSVSVKRFNSIENRYRHYFIRIQIAIICSISFFILLFRFWPEKVYDDHRLFLQFSGEQQLTPEMIVASRQPAVERLAPTVPRLITVPDDEVVDAEFNLELFGMSSEIQDLEPFSENEGETELVENPDRPPNVRRIVEPVMPSEVRRNAVRIQIDVLFVVSAQGEVEEATIDEIRMYNPATRTFEIVADIGYGLKEATLNAAYQWLFYPARHQDQPVRSISRHRFTFGS